MFIGVSRGSRKKIMALRYFVRTKRGRPVSYWGTDGPRERCAAWAVEACGANRGGEPRRLIKLFQRRAGLSGHPHKFAKPCNVGFVLGGALGIFRRVKRCVFGLHERPDVVGVLGNL